MLCRMVSACSGQCGVGQAGLSQLQMDNDCSQGGEGLEQLGRSSYLGFF